MVWKKKYSKKFRKLKLCSDPFHRSLWFAKVVNKLMYEGKKSILEKYVWNAFWKVKINTRKSVNVLLYWTLMKVRPSLGSIVTRLGKEFKIVPIELFPRRQLITGLKWLIETIRSNTLFSLESRIRTELEAFIKKEQSNLIKKEAKKRLEIYQNRLNTRFRWSKKR